ncbi:MAG: Hcp family type VI secretion system effector [Maricaulaceae bacterium]
MPTPAYLLIEGAKKGPVTTGAMSENSVGRLSKNSHRDRIQVQCMEGLIEMPKDEQTGQPSGRRRHLGFTIHKIFDSSSPDLYDMLAAGEQITRLELDFYRTNPSGFEEQYFKISCEGATITAIRTYFPNALDPAQKHMHHMEAVSFAYRKIKWEHLIANTVQTDNWDH